MFLFLDELSRSLIQRSELYGGKRSDRIFRGTFADVFHFFISQDFVVLCCKNKTSSSMADNQPAAQAKEHFRLESS